MESYEDELAEMLARGEFLGEWEFTDEQ